MPSWSSLFSCGCYRFLIVDGQTNVEVTVSHAYSATIRLKGKTDIMKFSKTVQMKTEVGHVLTDWAGVNTGSSDAEASGYNTPDFTEIMPWANANYFSGDVHGLTSVIYNGTGLLTTALLASVWDGTLNERLEADYARLDYGNIRLSAYHVSGDRKAITAQTVSRDAVGWTSVAAGSGWAVRWVDFVGFRGHSITTITTPYERLLLPLGVERLTEGPPATTTRILNIIGDVTPYGSDVQFWQTIYLLNDSDNSGYHLGFSSWMMEQAVKSRWLWLRDLIQTIIEGAVTIPLGTVVVNVDYNGDWLGSMADSRELTEASGDKMRYVLGSSATETFLYKKRTAGMEQVSVPSCITIPCYAISPI
jgi:hypothetical protein